MDMDSSESPVHGEQEGSSYNGHFGSTCYHPLFVFNQFGDCEGTMLRAGNVHSAHKWRQVLEPILSRYAETGLRRYVRADAAFAKPNIYEYLEERRVFYAIRLPRNKVLQYARRAWCVAWIQAALYGEFRLYIHCRLVSCIGSSWHYSGAF